MNKKFEQSVKAILTNQVSELTHVLARTKTLEELTDYLQKELPRELGTHCQVANWRDGVLVLQAENGSVATQLKFETGRLLSLMRKCPGYAGMASIKVIVQK